MQNLEAISKVNLELAEEGLYADNEALEAYISYLTCNMEGTNDNQKRGHLLR